MKNRFLVPLAVLGLVMLTQLACLDTNYYGVQPPARSQQSAAEIQADAQAGGDFFGAVGVAITVLIGGLIYLSKLGQRTGYMYGPVYWILLLGGIVAFAWGIIAFPVNALYVGVGGVALLLTVPWAIYGDR